MTPAQIEAVDALFDQLGLTLRERGFAQTLMGELFGRLEHWTLAAHSADVRRLAVSAALAGTLQLYDEIIRRTEPDDGSPPQT